MRPVTKIALFSASLFLSTCGGNPPMETEPEVTAPADITCDLFEGNVSIEGDALSVALETDLPDFTGVNMSVSRTYRASQDNWSVEDYSIEYFNQKSTVGQWRQAQSIDVSRAVFDEKWKESDATWEILRQAEIPFTIVEDSISEEIKVRFVVYVNQNNSAFAKWNANLSGRAVAIEGERKLVRWEGVYPLPLR